MILNVKANTHSYDVIIQKGCLKEAGQYFNLNRKVLIVTDSNIPLPYVEEIKKQCKTPFIFTFKAGEASKNFDTYKQIIEACFSSNLSRKDCIVALGGGVSGDMAGFAAATYMRGIDFYNIPTTVLSMVDSSIGGKTAIDLDGVKNIVGAFYPPMGVLIDVEVLKTLNTREIHAGLVESIKMSLTSNPQLFDFIYSSKDLNNDIEHIIEESLKIKKYVVEEDEKEQGLRQILNFGHTIGHAIETKANGHLLHGECVGIGMTYVVSKDLKSKLIDVLKKYNLPFENRYSKEELLSFITHDKKANNEYVNLVRVDKIGEATINKIEIKSLEDIL